MTAIIGILNKKAAVMASDRAVTVTNGDTVRIYNNTTKIFKLSDTYPVAVMLFGSVEFMDVPIEVLVSRYRKCRGGEAAPTLQDYVDRFIQYLGNDEPLLRDSEAQDAYLCDEMLTYYEKVKDFSQELIRKDIDAIHDCEPSDDEVNEFARTRIREGIASIAKKTKNNKCPELKHYPFTDFVCHAKTNIDSLMDLCREDGIPTDMRDDWERGLYDYLCSDFFYNDTGLVFVGYGTGDIYPSLIPIYISGIFDGHFRYRYSEDENERITNDHESSIRPFAQSAGMMTVIKGISPRICSDVEAAAAHAIEQTKGKMLAAMKYVGLDDDTIARVKRVETTDIMKRFSQDIQDFVQTEYIDGLMDMIASFGVEDMADTAENLIKVANFHRRFTSSAETVGASVDVAVVTLDRGFVWLKHYDWMAIGQEVAQ